MSWAYLGPLFPWSQYPFMPRDYAASTTFNGGDSCLYSYSFSLIRLDLNP